MIRMELDAGRLHRRYLYYLELGVFGDEARHLRLAPRLHGFARRAA